MGPALLALRLVVFALALLSIIGSRAGAQTAPGTQVYASWMPTGRAALSVTTASGRVAFASPGPSALVCNTGSNDAYVKLGDVTVTAVAATSYLVPAGQCKVYNTAPFPATIYTYIAGITASSTTTLYIETGLGEPLPILALSGSVTANAGTNLNTSALATSAQLGEVQASPTANTVLDRLKTLNTTLGTPLQAGGNVVVTQLPGYSFSNITTSTTTTVKSGAGVIHQVTVNTKGTVASTVTIYDYTAGSGTKIGTIDSLTLSGSFFFDTSFATGLTVVTTGTAAPDITVSYR